jgi:hypothetical protein
MDIARIPVEGDITFHTVEKVELDKLYELTGADTVEHVALTREGQEASTFLDEEGKLNGRPVNRRADWLLHMFSGLASHDTIVGDVVICGMPDEDGESTGLTTEWRAFLADKTTFADIEQPA